VSGFSCNPSIIPAVPAGVEPVIANDGWFPDVDPVAFRRQMRIRDGVTPDRLREAILGAMITVGDNLAAWRAPLEAGGAATLAAVPAPGLGGESRLLVLYRRALGAFAKADLVERYRDMDLTGAGQRQVGDLDASIEELRRDGIFAIRDMIGRPRLLAELI